MHPRNRYQKPHDFPALAIVVPELAAYFVTTPDGRISLDFADPGAVRQLNKALLLRDYGLKYWDIPAGNLCPGVPGRLDYVHLIADLLAGNDQAGSRDVGTTHTGRHQARPQVQGNAFKEQGRTTGLDIGTGASLIYPILGVMEYGWHFVGTDVDERSLKVAEAIAGFNPGLKGKIALRRQPDRTAIFANVIRPGEYFAFTMCNPPFFDSAAAAAAAARQKWEKLGKADQPSPTLNFGGQANELWTAGGEPAFLRRMIGESVEYGAQVGWFTTLVSKKGYLKIAEIEFGRIGITDWRVVGMGRGGKIRRVLCWRIRPAH